MDENNYCVYMHIAPNNKKYIGQTKQLVNRRWRNGKGYIKNVYFYRAIEKYGWENFQHIILKSNLSLEEANFFEKKYISLYKTTNPIYGYNIEKGGDSHEVNERTREKFRKIAKEREPVSYRSYNLIMEDGSILIKCDSGIELANFLKVKPQKIYDAACKINYKINNYFVVPEDKLDFFMSNKLFLYKNPSLPKALIAYDKLNDKYEYYESIREASRNTGVDRKTISFQIRNNKGESKQYIFRKNISNKT